MTEREHRKPAGARLPDAPELRRAGVYERAFKEHGFLSEELIGPVRVLVRTSASPWFEQAETLSRLGQAMYVHCSDRLYGRSTHEPLSLVLQMMPRALGAFQGALILAERGMVPEARTLIRGLYETAIWAEYLRRVGNEAVQHIKATTLEGQRKGFNLARSHIHGPEQSAIEARLAEIEAELKTLPRPPQLKAVAEQMGQAALLRYQTFGDLSGGAAHVTLWSLDTYLQPSKADKGTVNHSVGPDYARVPETMLLACEGLWGVLEELRLIADHTLHDEEFRHLYTRHCALAEQTG